MEKLILIGAGGHSKSVIDSVENDLYEVCGFIDEYKAGEHLGLQIFGNRIEDIPNYEGYSYFISIGDVKFRKAWFKKVKALGLKTVNIIDKTAIISNTASIGTGNFIGKLAIINADATIGDNNVINTKALVEHECVIASHVHLSTNATINGNVKVDDGVFMGSTAVCNGQLELGKYSVIGSGSVIISDVEEYTTVVGVPAKMVKRSQPDD